MVLLDAIRTQAETDRSGLRVLYALMFEALGPDEELRTRFAKFHDTLRADFARSDRGRTARRLDPPRPRLRQRGHPRSSAVCRGIAYQWLLEPDHFDPVGALAYLHDTTTARLAIG